MAGEKDWELRPGAISAFGRETIAGLHCFVVQFGCQVKKHPIFRQAIKN